MSAYSETAVKEFKDGELLCEALREMGFQPQVNIGNPQPLTGYQGDYRTPDGRGHTRNASEAMKADIIIPRAQVGGASNDIGFVRKEDGSYSAILSDYDRSCGFNEGWLKKAKVSYTQKGIERQAKRAGLTMVGKPKTNAQGQIVYEFLKA